MIAMTMKRIIAELPKDGFVRVHKSYIIPFAKIKAYNNETVTTDALKIAIGRSYKKSFLEKMQVRKKTVFG
jgi:DNA-binding LytR/AlgR family response regulator